MIQHKEIGALTAKLVSPDGSLDQGCKRGFPNIKNSIFYYSQLGRLFTNNAFFNGYKLNHLDENELHEVDAFLVHIW